MSNEESHLESAAALTATVLEEEAARQEAQSAKKEILFADDLLPGVGADPMTMKEGLAKGGSFTFVVLLLLNSLDELEAGVFNVLSPEIGDTLGVSDGVIGVIAAASLAFFVLGAVPLGWLADRRTRAPIVGFATLMWGAFVFMSGLAVNAFMMFWTRFFAGLAKANTLTVHPSLVADAYPVEVRGRLFSTTALVGRAVGLASPLLAGVIADAAGEDGWRWAFYTLGIPAAMFAFLAFRIPEPPRGQYEQQDVLGELLGAEEIQPSMETAFDRLWQIKTLKNVIVAFSAMGFYLFVGGVYTFQYLEDHYGLSATERGFAGTGFGLGVVAVAPFVGKYFDSQFRKDPAKALALVGYLLLPVAVLVPIQFAMPNVYLFVFVGAIAQALMGSAFSVVNPVTQAVVPYKLRGMGQAMSTLFIFLIGGIGGALLGALIVDAYGQRTAITVLSIPAMTVGGFLILRSATLIKNDMSLIVAELSEELDEQERQKADPENIPAIQVNDIDFSYGQVQVLFDLAFDVKRGETLALLGTNGAGKSTILKVITGLGTPSRGVVRHHGKTITYVSPERRAAMGIQMLPGGNGTFPSLSIRDNLVIGAYQYRDDPADVERRIEKVLALFPALKDRLSEKAGDLSGGQQQMLALARVMLHEPDVLVIDELSLGLAPAVVQSLLELVDTLKAAGQTMIIVEQSLNVALAIADRAIFLEKGQVRFEGSAQELVERDDLARAVFLGQEGG